MNPRAKPEISDPLARRVDDWLTVMNRAGWAAVIAGLVLAGLVSSAIYFAPVLRDKFQAETEAAKANKLAADVGRTEMLLMREEYARHEAEHVQATLEMAAKQEKTNQLLQDAQRMMAPAVESRARMERIQEGILEALKAKQLIERGAADDLLKGYDGGERKTTRQVDTPGYQPGLPAWGK